MKTLTSLRFVLSLAVLVLALGCSSTLNFDAEWNHSFDFSSLKTYSWIPQDVGPVKQQQLPEHLDLRLRRIVDDVLMDHKGYQKAPSPAQADFLLAYYIDTKKGLKVDYSSYSQYYGGYGYGYWPGYRGIMGGPGFYGAGDVPSVREYTTGTLVLDIVDPKTHTLIWTGVVEGEPKYSNPSGERVTEVMTKMLAGFPPE